VEVTVAAEDLKLALSIASQNGVDDMIDTLRLLRVADCPVTDLLKPKEAFLDSELSLVLLELVCG